MSFVCPLASKRRGSLPIGLYQSKIPSYYDGRRCLLIGCTNHQRQHTVTIGLHQSQCQNASRTPNEKRFFADQLYQSKRLSYFNGRHMPLSARLLPREEVLCRSGCTNPRDPVTSTEDALRRSVVPIQETSHCDDRVAPIPAQESQRAKRDSKSIDKWAGEAP
eukprot:4815353-Heterocapsa_arctica.AAC.1